jgi:hypothetical protein
LNRLAVVFFLCSLLVLAGYIQPFPTLHLIPADSFIFITIIVMVWAVPLVVVALAFVRLYRARPASHWISQVSALFVFIFGGILAILSGALAGTGSDIVLTQGILLVFALTASLLWQAYGHLGKREVYVALVGMGLAASGACWSLATVPAVIIQANQIAGGAPFCIGAHGRTTSIESLWDLRGFSFYTTATGYKDTSRWYFHGVLVVQTKAGRRYFNWSPRSFSFHPVPNFKGIAGSSNKECSPSDHWSFAAITG